MVDRHHALLLQHWRAAMAITTEDALLIDDHDVIIALNRTAEGRFGQQLLNQPLKVLVEASRGGLEDWLRTCRDSEQPVPGELVVHGAGWSEPRHVQARGGLLTQVPTDPGQTRARDTLRTETHRAETHQAGSDRGGAPPGGAADGSLISVLLTFPVPATPDTAAARPEQPQRLRELTHQVDGLQQQLHAHHVAAQLVQEQEERFRLAFDVSLIGMAIEGLDPSAPGRILRVNEELCHLLGRPAEQLVGRSVAEFAAPEHRADITAVITAMAGGQLHRWEGERRYLRPDGREVWALVRKGRVNTGTTPGTGAPGTRGDGGAGYLITHFEDITERHLAEQQLVHLALHDSLTGLPNRYLLIDHLDAALARGRREHRHVGLLFVDLDDFKIINDTLGHHAGDEVLITVADRLRAALRTTDTAARYGGDEFVVICESIATVGDVEDVAARILDAVAQPVLLRGRTVLPQVSIGIALTDPARPVNAETLMSDADAALYQAKTGGKGVHAAYTADLRAAAQRRLDVDADLRQALRDGQLRVHYQPIVNLNDLSLAGAEALVRWQHPARGLLAPAEFIDVAEQSDLIVDLGEWVLQQATAWLADWHEHADTLIAPPPPTVTSGRLTPARRLAVTVNASVRQVASGRLRRRVEAALETNRLRPGELHIEITESQFMTAAPAIHREMQALFDLGIGLSLDDFGTGYSSLAYLKRLPFNCIKLDRSYVSGIGRDSNDEAIVGAVLSLARAMNLHTVAEGVETLEQEQYLRDLGCGYAQGYRYARPGPTIDPTALPNRPA